MERVRRMGGQGLVLLGRAAPTIELAAACALVVGGAWIATRRRAADALR